MRDLTQAWDIYYHVFQRISKQLPQLTSLELQYVSPKLLKCRDLELAVPGSYSPGQELIRISSIQTNLQVIFQKYLILNYLQNYKMNFFLGNHKQATTKKTLHSWIEWKRLHVFVERSRRFATR